MRILATYNIKGGVLIAKRDFKSARASFEKAFELYRQMLDGSLA